MKSQTPNDALARQISATLDAAAQQPDPALDRALHQARLAAQAGQAHKPRWQPWLLASGFALAAGLAAVVILPQALQPSPTPARLEASAPVPNVDPELLEDMDFLIAMHDARG